MKNFIELVKKKAQPVFDLMNEMNLKNTGVLAAGSAYFIVLSFFPFMAAIVAISSIVISPDDLEGVFAAINTYLPSDISTLVRAQLEAAQREQASSLIFAVIAVSLALFSVSGGVDNFSRALNAVFGLVKEESFVAARFRSLLSTLGILLFSFMFGALIAANFETMKSIGFADWSASLISIVRWLLVAFLLFLFVGFMYRYVPERKDPGNTPIVSVGSVVAVLLLVLFTSLFFMYARYFANFSDSYSLFAGVIVLMLWCNLVSMAILIGAHIDVLRRGKSAE